MKNFYQCGRMVRSQVTLLLTGLDHLYVLSTFIFYFGGLVYPLLEIFNKRNSTLYVHCLILVFKLNIWRVLGASARAGFLRSLHGPCGRRLNAAAACPGRRFRGAAPCALLVQEVLGEHRVFLCTCKRLWEDSCEWNFWGRGYLLEICPVIL